MQTILFISNKGGTGTSTLAYNIAIFAATNHEVVAVDMDPTGGFAICASNREDPTDNLLILEDVVSVASAIEKLTATGNARDYLIVDAPKSFASKMREAIAAADVIVLPIKPSPLDLRVNEEIVELVRELGKIDRAIFVVNGVDGRSSLGKETMEILAARSPHRPVRIADRVDYKRSLILGLAAFEVSKSAEVEISALWDAIQHVLARKTANDEARQHA